MSLPARILVVDDEAPNRTLVKAMLKSLGWEPELASDGIEALALLPLEFDLMLLDLSMPGLDGFEVIRRVRASPDWSDLPIIMITGLSDAGTRLQAVEAGANDFISKPFDRTELRVRVTSLLKMKAAQDALRRHQAVLEELVEKRTTALRQALDETVRAQRQAYRAQLETIERLALAAEFKDEATARHIHRVGHYVALLARHAGLSPGEVECLSRASALHDIGKVAVPHAILLKPGPLEPAERLVMQEHTLIGGQILHASRSPLLQMGETIALTHHERWDGAGYPHGLTGDEIPLPGRIMAIADVFDALTSPRPYKPAFESERAWRILEEGEGAHFDPRLAALFREERQEVERIRREHQSDGT